MRQDSAASTVPQLGSVSNISLHEVRTARSAKGASVRRQLAAQWNHLAREGKVCELLDLAAARCQDGSPLTNKDRTVLLRTLRIHGPPAQLAQALVVAAPDEPDLILLQEILCAYRRLGRVSDAVSAFDAAKARGLVLSCFHYTTMIALCADRGDAQQAEAYLRELRASGAEPDAMLYATLINAYGRAGLPEEAQRVFDHLQREERLVDAPLCGALIDALGRAGHVDRSVRIFDKMQRAGLRGQAAEYGALLFSLCRAGFVERARTLMAGMEREGRPMDAGHQGALLKALLRAGRPQEAEALFEVMRAQGRQTDPASPRLLIHRYGREGRLQDAERIFRGVCNAGRAPDEAEYGAFLSALARAGLPAKAQATIDQMRAEGMSPNHIHLGTLVDSYEGLPFTKLPAAEQVVLVDGWSIKFERWLTSVENIRTRVEKAPLTSFAAQMNGKPFDTTVRYAFSFDLSPVEASTQPVNLDASDEAALAEMWQRGWSNYVEITATHGPYDPADDMSFKDYPTKVRFKLGWGGAVSYLNCSNPDNGSDEQTNRGVQPAKGGKKNADIYLHVEHPLWDQLNVENPPVRFDAIAARATTKMESGQLVGEVTMDDLAGVAVSRLTDKAGAEVKDRTVPGLLKDYVRKTGALSYSPNGASVSDLKQFITYSAQALAHLNGEGICYVQRT